MSSRTSFPNPSAVILRADDSLGIDSEISLDAEAPVALEVSETAESPDEDEQAAATLDLAAESGLGACTFEAISERSGIARSTLYRHWKNSSELVVDAIKSQSIERVAADTGTLRDDMLHWMLELGRALEPFPRNQ